MAADTNIEKHIVHKLNDMRLNGVMCDLELVADDGTCVMVHSTMWIAAFEDPSCLKDMGKDYSLSSKQLDIYGVNGCTLKMVVDFIYGNDVTTNDDLNRALEKFGMKNWESFLTSKYKSDNSLINERPSEAYFFPEHVDTNNTVTEETRTPKKKSCNNVTVSTDRNNATNTTCVTVKVENEETTEHVSENDQISMSENNKRNELNLQWENYVSKFEENSEIDLSRVKEEPVSPEDNFEFFSERDVNDMDSDHEYKTQETAWNKDSESYVKKADSEHGEFDSEENYIFRSKTDKSFSDMESSNDQQKFQENGSRIAGKRHYESNCDTNLPPKKIETPLLHTLNKQWSSSRSTNRKKKVKHRKSKKHFYSQECTTTKYRTLLPKGNSPMPVMEDRSLPESHSKGLAEDECPSVSENATEIYGSKTTESETIEDSSALSTDTLKMRDTLEMKSEYLINGIDSSTSTNKESLKPECFKVKTPKPVGLFLNTSNFNSAKASSKSPKKIVEQSCKRSENKQGSNNNSSVNETSSLVEGPNRKSLETDMNGTTIVHNSQVVQNVYGTLPLPLGAMPNTGIHFFGNNQEQNTIGNISSGFLRNPVVGTVPYMNTPAPVFATPSQMYPSELGSSIGSSMAQVVQNKDLVNIGVNNANNLGPLLVVNGTGNQNTVLQYNYVVPSQSGALPTVNNQPIPILGNSFQYLVPTSVSQTGNGNNLAYTGIQQAVLPQVDTRITAKTGHTKVTHVPATLTMNTKPTYVPTTLTKNKKAIHVPTTMTMNTRPTNVPSSITTKPTDGFTSTSASEDISKSTSLPDGKLKSPDKSKNDVPGGHITLALDEIMQGKDCDDPLKLVNFSGCDDTDDISVGRKKGCTVEEMCAKGADIGKRMPLMFQKVDPVTNVAVYEAVFEKDTSKDIDQSTSCPTTGSGDSSSNPIAKELLKLMGNKRKPKNKIVMLGRKDAASRHMAKSSDPCVVRKRGRGRPPKNVAKNAESLQTTDRTESKIKDGTIVKDQFKNKGRPNRQDSSKKAALARTHFRPIAPKR